MQKHCTPQATYHLGERQEQNTRICVAKIVIQHQLHEINLCKLGGVGQVHV
jgi:hypothetical protein